MASLGAIHQPYLVDGVGLDSESARRHPPFMSKAACIAAGLEVLNRGATGDDLRSLLVRISNTNTAAWPDAGYRGLSQRTS